MSEEVTVMKGRSFAKTDSYQMFDEVLYSKSGRDATRRNFLRITRRGEIPRSTHLLA